MFSQKRKSSEESEREVRQRVEREVEERVAKELGKREVEERILREVAQRKEDIERQVAEQRIVREVQKRVEEELEKRIEEEVNKRVAQEVKHRVEEEVVEEHHVELPQMEFVETEWDQVVGKMFKCCCERKGCETNVFFPVRHYNGDYLKTIDARDGRFVFTFSKYSAERLRQARGLSRQECFYTLAYRTDEKQVFTPSDPNMPLMEIGMLLKCTHTHVSVQTYMSNENRVEAVDWHRLDADMKSYLFRVNGQRVMLKLESDKRRVDDYVYLATQVIRTYPEFQRQNKVLGKLAFFMGTQKRAGSMSLLQTLPEDFPKLILSYI